MAKIIIQRKSSVVSALCSFDVYLMDQYVGELKNGGTLQFDANVGSYIIEFKAKPRMNKMADTSFGVVVNDSNEVVILNAGFKMSGKFSVEYADGQQHIPTYTMTFSGQNQGTSATQALQVAPSTPEAPNVPNTSSAASTSTTFTTAGNTAPKAKGTEEVSVKEQEIREEDGMPDSDYRVGSAIFHRLPLHGRR